MEDSSVVPRPRVCAPIVLLALLASACLPHGLAFTQDKRVDIVAPEDHSDVELPVTVRWRVSDFDVTGHNGSDDPDAGYFGVFVDRAPVPPGKPVTWVAHGDKQCRPESGCPDKDYLHDRGVYETTDLTFTMKQLTDQNAYHGHESHEVTVVLLDGQGNRIGESAWYVDFFYQRDEG